MLNNWSLRKCTTGQQSGKGCVLATAKTDRLAAEHLQKKRHRPDESIITRSCSCSYEVCQRALKCLLERMNTLKYVQLYLPYMFRDVTCVVNIPFSKLSVMVTV